VRSTKPKTSRLAEAFALRSLGQPRAAIDTAGAAGQLYDAAGDRGGIALSLRYVSMGLADEGDLSGARQAAEQGLAIRRELGDQQGTARPVTGRAAKRVGSGGTT